MAGTNIIAFDLAPLLGCCSALFCFAFLCFALLYSALLCFALLSPFSFPPIAISLLFYGIC